MAEEEEKVCQAGVERGKQLTRLGTAVIVWATSGCTATISFKSNSAAGARAAPIASSSNSVTIGPTFFAFVKQFWI